MRVETELRSLRTDVDQLKAQIEAQNYVAEIVSGAERYADHLRSADDAAYELAGMTSVERRYFERGGLTVPAALVRLSDWWAKFRKRHGF